MPNDFEIIVKHARHAVNRKDWPEALRRWEAVARRFDDNFLGPLGMAQSLKELGRYVEATRRATLTAKRFPASPWGYAELAAIAAAEGDLQGVVHPLGNRPRALP